MQSLTSNSPHRSYSNKNLCGAVVAFKFACALYESFSFPKEEAEELLEFAAIATVGDVMELQGENRILVKSGFAGLPIQKMWDFGS